MLDSSSTKGVSVKDYEIQISRSDFWPILMYLCRVSFLTTLNIYKDYFKGRLGLHKCGVKSCSCKL